MDLNLYCIDGALALFVLVSFLAMLTVSEFLNCTDASN